MSDAKNKSAKPTRVIPSLTEALGVIPTLPGESEEEYRQGLQTLIQELEAKTVLQVYLAEKIFECLWWMRRYQQQKRATLAREMAKILNNMDSETVEPFYRTVRIVSVSSLSQNDERDDNRPSGNDKTASNDKMAIIAQDMEIVLNPSRRKEFEKLLEKSVHTEQSLMQQAFNSEVENIANLDGQIALLAKTLSTFQSTYETLTSRKLNLERLRLQNELLSRDLNAIELEALPDAGQPKKTRRQPA